MKISEKVLYCCPKDEPFDMTIVKRVGTVVEVCEDHFIIDVPEISDHIWIDKDNADMVKKPDCEECAHFYECDNMGHFEECLPLQKDFEIRR